MEGTPKQYAPEEIAELEKSRTISDAGLLKKGATYKIDEDGNKLLLVTDKLSKIAKEEAPRDIKEKDIASFKNLLEGKGIKEGDKVTVKYLESGKVKVINGYYYDASNYQSTSDDVSGKNVVRIGGISLEDFDAKRRGTPPGYNFMIRMDTFPLVDFVDISCGWGDATESNIKTSEFR